MVAGRLFEEAWPMEDRPALGVVGTPDQSADPGMADRARAHGAGFQRDIQGQTAEAVVAQGLTGLAQSLDLGMGGRVVGCDRAVAAFAQDMTGRFVDHDGAHRHLAGLGRRLRKRHRHAHEPLIMDRHPRDNADKPRPRQGRDASPRPTPRAAAPTQAAAPQRTERIAKALARAGIASRREVERLIGLGRVAVNGRILDTPATLVTRDDTITVDGKPIGAAQATRVWRYNKPVGLLTSHKDPQGRPTVFDALPAGLPRVISIGRLDINTEGLLLLTNDGELSRALELPATALVRQYRARARGRVTQADLDTLKDGTTIDGVRYGPVEATIDKAKTQEDGTQSANLWISVSITEGKNREVRKVLESIGLTVNRLIRLAYGPFQLGTLPSGSIEEVGPRVIREVLAAHIRPENLPTGNSVATPAPIPGRRSATPIVKGRSGSALSDPSRKPSRVRAAEGAVAEGEARAERRAKKPAGWAKAKPRSDHARKDDKPRARFAKSIEDKVIGPRSDTWARDADKPRRAGGAGTKTRPAPARKGPPRKPAGPGR